MKENISIYIFWFFLYNIFLTELHFVIPGINKPPNPTYNDHNDTIRIVMIINMIISIITIIISSSSSHSSPPLFLIFSSPPSCPVFITFSLSFLLLPLLPSLLPLHLLLLIIITGVDIFFSLFQNAVNSSDYTAG